jgi:hypothetical protein
MSKDSTDQVQSKTELEEKEKPSSSSQSPTTTDESMKEISQDQVYVV